MSIEQPLQLLRDAVTRAGMRGHVFLVGGYVRDRLLGRAEPNEIDLVLEGDAPALAQKLFELGSSDIHPVIYPRFGTAMIVVCGLNVELVGARAESYPVDSRKPAVAPATLKDDAFRRDFTCNSLMENLHTGEMLDLTGRGMEDLRAGILRTPLEPCATFNEDPLRMLRAVRFAAQLGFTIAPEAAAAIQEQAQRLAIISQERIRDEFAKLMLSQRAADGMQMLADFGLLAQCLPELLESVGCGQNEFHLYDVWEHTLQALRNLPPHADLVTRLGTLFHDIGKPATKSISDDARIHFYRHEDVGAEMTHRLLHRLKFANEDADAVAQLVRQHMRIGTYNETWSDGAVRRLIRDAGEHLERLFTIFEADRDASKPLYPGTDIAALRQRMADIQATRDANSLQSPLTGQEIMELLGIPPGKDVGRMKDHLLNEVIEGRLAPDDKTSAAALLKSLDLREV